ncbi:MAG: DNA-formamidopyrimidine glycosylase [Timaviella obliquedivisa GSE-PSE-MK23-08B]|jgi:formamidopyrimidine-DNA glycosylase|nr:DNA-formamidopyrimidine glycosylase [Timaviella obliquedivisa GSE-PSE-MK23-08B]
MPELPEVETVCRGLNQMTLNQEVRGGEVLLERTIAHPFLAADFLAGLTGVAIAQWQRRGKYLLAELTRSAPKTTLEPAGWLGVHLRMTGQLLWMSQDEPLQKHCRVRLFFPGGQELRFIDQRTFGQMWWVPPEKRPEEVMKTLALLGPEPFSPEFSVQYFAGWLGDRQRPIKNALLDQTLVAGIGNIYADESLFLSKINPKTRCADLKRKQIQKLHASIIQVLQDSIGEGGTTFSDFRDIKGINGNYGNVAWVYDREGLPCQVCGSLIERVKMAGRSAHFCPRCQQL